jgi:hypothetical protein
MVRPSTLFLESCGRDEPSALMSAVVVESAPADVEELRGMGAPRKVLGGSVSSFPVAM